ncbi:MAG: hypothetical protein JWO70_1788 [Betaproteobacteria bacterium]|nr:hypothetical protein [Betaproteobacteria bacterium]
MPVDPPEIPIEPPKELAFQFNALRGISIQFYANYEQALAALFSHLMGAPPDFTGVAFFRINNARARNAMIERLLKKRQGDTYNIFWNSLVKLLGQLDGSRNQIVHWNVVNNISLENGQPKYVLTLRPPNHWDETPNTPEITEDGIKEFIYKCHYLTRSVNVFNSVVSGNLGERLPDAWRDICREPVPYPPPESHLLYLTP